MLNNSVQLFSPRPSAFSVQTSTFSEKLEDSAKRVVEHTGDRTHDRRYFAIGDVLGSADRLCNQRGKSNQRRTRP